MRINSYLADHPEMVLGELAVEHGMYGADTLRSDPGKHSTDTPGQLRRRARRYSSAEARTAGLVGARATRRHAGGRRRPVAPVALAPEGAWDGHIAAYADGSFTVASDGLAEPLAVPASHRAELRALLELRDSARALLGAEASTLEDTTEIAELRAC